MLAPTRHCALILAALSFAPWTSEAMRKDLVVEKAMSNDSIQGTLRLKDERSDDEWHAGGAFEGMIVERDFDTAKFWGRDDKVVNVEHVDEDGDVIISAQYNGDAHVSDIVFYHVMADRFCVGCGRGTGWHNDEELALGYEGEGAGSHAQRADYNGVGFFLIDRGHQAPVGSFNNDDDEADITNLPTNLSPQSGRLNQNNWRFFEAQIRKYAADHQNWLFEADDDDALDAITGPLYELPPALLQAEKPKEIWKQFLSTGGTRTSSKGVEKMDPVPWCATDNKDGTYMDNLGKKAGITCTWEDRQNMGEPSDMTKGQLKAALQKIGQPTSGSKPVLVKRLESYDARENPNLLKIQFSAGKRSSTSLRVPLGYFKMFVVKAGSELGMHTCAVIMDQIGQCLVVSVPVLEQIAHLDFEETHFMEEVGEDYTDEVDRDFCVPPDSVLGKRNACVDFTEIDDADEITESAIDEYWKKMEAEA